MNQSALVSDKLYSIRQAKSFIPWIKNETEMQKLIHKDLENGNIFKTSVIKRGKRILYFIKGSVVNNLINR
jgi:hypothetical protein